MSIFTTEEKNKLESFLSLVDKIKQLRLFRENLPVVNIIFDISSKDAVSRIEVLDEEILRSVLLDLRKIFAQNEATNFGSICNLIYKKVNNAKIREEISAVREAYNRSLKETEFKIEINDHKVTPQEALKLWFNGYYFHENQEVNKKLFGTYANFNKVIKFQFMAAVKILAMHTFHLSQIVEKVVKL